MWYLLAIDACNLGVRTAAMYDTLQVAWKMCENYEDLDWLVSGAEKYQSIWKRDDLRTIKQLYCWLDILDDLPRKEAVVEYRKVVKCPTLATLRKIVKGYQP